MMIIAKGPVPRVAVAGEGTGGAGACPILFTGDWVKVFTGELVGSATGIWTGLWDGALVTGSS